MPPKGKWGICPEEKGRMSIMNKKVLGIAAAAAAAGGAVYAASKVKKQAQAQGMRREKESLQSRNYGDKQVYLVGGGLASMAAAAYLVRDANFDGHNIHILESMDVLGGSNDGAVYSRALSAAVAVCSTKRPMKISGSCSAAFRRWSNRSAASQRKF